MPWSCSVRIISRPVRSPTCARRGYRWPPKLRCRMRPSLVRSNTAPQASSSRTRSGASLACSSAIRQLFRYWPPRMVSAKWTFQLSRSSTCPIEAAMPPSAMTVWALPSSDLQTRPTDRPAADDQDVVLVCLVNGHLEDPRIGDDARRAQADVDVGERHPDE